jgi:drug/metabolite transporter (DMT)-like permease
MMAWPTIVCGALLVAVGLVGYTQQDPEHVSPTALIPAAIGAVLMLCGALAFSDKLRKHVMHLAAMMGLLGAIGGFVPLQRQLKNSDTFDPLKPSAISGELMILICVVFVGLCVRSFIAARKARQAAARTVTG